MRTIKESESYEESKNEYENAIRVKVRKESGRKTPMKMMLAIKKT